MQVLKQLAISIAAIVALHGSAVYADTDEDRIKRLETIVEKQQQLIEALDAELKRLKQAVPEHAESAARTVMVEELDRVQQAVAPEPAPDADTATGALDPLSVNIYGFAMADAIYDFKRVDPNWEDTLRVTTVPTRSGAFGEDGNFAFGVRQSRMGVSGTYGDDISFILEAELFGVGGDEGQTTPRLRQAWATYKNFGMGQYWSNFMDIDIFPNTIDYWGPTGMVFYRNQQARYTFPLGDDEFSIAIEDPDTALTVGKFRDTDLCDLPDAPPDCESSESIAGDVFQAHNDVPDLSVRYRNNGDFGHFQVAGMFRKLGYERLDTGQKDDEFGWGVNTSAGLRFFNNDMLKLQVVYGEGIGNYMNDGGVDIAPDSDDLLQAQAEAVELIGISAYYDHYWNNEWSTSIGWSMIDLESNEGRDNIEFETGQIAQINLLHYPVDNVLLGTEFIWGQREDVSGNTGSDYRIQFSLKVNFDSGDLMRFK
ncbi:MAG: DcaP family trimeric outer membrane transporter [Halieaceae bacterium]